MKILLRKIPLIRWLDDFTDTVAGQFLTGLVCAIAITMLIWYWRTLK